MSPRALDANSEPRVIIYGSSTVPYAPLSGSPSALLCSQDGQYAIVTRDEIHLLTPQLPEPSKSEPRSIAPKNDKGKGKATTNQAEPGNEPTRNKRPRQANWTFSKTLLKVDKKNSIKWSDWVDDFEVSTNGQVDPYWRSATFSPAGVSSLGGCVLATLNTNAEVSVFEPKKDGNLGEWRETFDLTSEIVHDIVNPGLPQKIKVPEQTIQIRREFAHLVSKAQATSIAWSGPLPLLRSDNDQPRKIGSEVDGSILAVGHRSGEVSLWRHDSDRTRCLKRFRPKSKHVNWISLLKWSEWRRVGQEYVADLALSDSDGRVWVQTITQTRQRSDENGGGGDDVDMEAAGESLKVTAEQSSCLELVVEKDRRSVSQFCWIEGTDEGRISLVYTKLGTVNVLCLTRQREGRVEVGKNEEIELELPRKDSNGSSSNEHARGLWAGSTNWASCCGLIYSVSSNSLLIYLSSSLIYRLPLSSSKNALPPSLLPSPEHTRSTRALYDQVVQDNAQTIQSLDTEEGQDEGPQNGGKRKLSKYEGPKIFGVLPLVGAIEGEGAADEFGFIFETQRPDLFHYKAPSLARTHLAIVNISNQSIVDASTAYIEHVERILNDSETNALHNPPSQTLLPVLDALSLYARSPEFVSSLLETLSRELVPETSITSTVPLNTNEGESIGSRVASALYGAGAAGLERMRKKMIIAQRLSAHPDVPASLRVQGEQVKVTIERELIRTVVSKFANLLSKTKELSDSERPFLTRLLLATSAFPRPSTVSTLGGDAESLETAFESASNCPACQSSIPIGNVRKGVCLNGHAWERCSITLEIVSRVDVRTCRECHRKALTTVSGTAEGEMDRVHEILRGVRCCAYCGGRWIRVR